MAVGLWSIGLWRVILTFRTVQLHNVLIHFLACSLSIVPTLTALQMKAAEKAALNIQKKVTTHALPIRQYLVSTQHQERRQTIVLLQLSLWVNFQHLSVPAAVGSPDSHRVFVSGGSCL